MHDLKALRELADKACGAAFDNREQIPGPVNWGDLGCSDARYILHEDGSSSHAVVIEEAAPDAYELQQFIAKELKRFGYKDIRVITEW